MIIYGWNSKNIKQAPIENHKCGYCGDKNSQLAVIAQYFHIFWIPLLVYRKSIHVVCMSCKLYLEEKEFPPEDHEFKQKLKTLKKAVRTPIYLYAGLIVLAVGIGHVIFKSLQNNYLQSGYIQNPEIGDVYVLKDPDELSRYNHYLLKVEDIVGDSLHVTFNSFSYNSVIEELNASDGFYDVWYSMHINELHELDQSGELKKVIRDYSTYSGFNRVLEYQFPDSSEVQ